MAIFIMQIVTRAFQGERNPFQSGKKGGSEDETKNVIEKLSNIRVLLQKSI